MNVLVSMIGKYSIRGHQFGIVIIPPAVVLLLSSSSLFDNPVGGIYSPFLTVSNFGVGVTKSSSKKKKRDDINGVKGLLHNTYLFVSLLEYFSYLYPIIYSVFPFLLI